MVKSFILAAVLLLAATFTQAQTLTEVKPGVYAVAASSRASADSTDTGKRLLVGGAELTVWRSARGAYYTSRVSGKTGLAYRAYLSAEAVAQMGLPPKPATSKAPEK